MVFGNWRVVFGNRDSETGSGIRKLRFGNWEWYSETSLRKLEPWYPDLEGENMQTGGMRIFEKSMPHNAETIFSHSHWSLKQRRNGHTFCHMLSMVPFLQELEHKCRKWLLCASGVKGMAHKNSWSGEAVKLKNAIVCKALGGGQFQNVLELWHPIYLSLYKQLQRRALSQPTNSKTALNHAGLSDLDQVDSNDQALGMSQAALTVHTRLLHRHWAAQDRCPRHFL